MQASRCTHHATVRNDSRRFRHAGVRRRAEIYYQQFDALKGLRQGVRRELLAEARKHPVMRLLRQIPAIGPIRAALLIALMQTPNRLRTKRQLWAYCGLALRTYTSGERANTPELLNMTWAGERSEQPRSFQSPVMFFLLTLPFIEDGY